MTALSMLWERELFLDGLWEREESWRKEDRLERLGWKLLPSTVERSGKAGSFLCG